MKRSGLRDTAISSLAVAVGAAIVGKAAGIFSLTEAFLLVVACAELAQALLSYYGQDMNYSAV